LKAGAVCGYDFVNSCFETAENTLPACGFFFHDHIQDSQVGAQDSSVFSHQSGRKRLSAFSAQSAAQKAESITLDT
jgi:hypothetical protein